MNQDNITIKRALISVSDKTGLISLARGLQALNVELISTGGTYQALIAADIPAREVSDITHYPEMMDGRVKTLHPLLHGGILGLRDQHAEIAKKQGIDWIDLVIVNLYPFAETIKDAAVTLDTAIENIDIGGPTLIRGAAKNMGWVGVVVSPTDYEPLLQELKTTGGLTFAFRSQLAAKAFTHTAQYDSVIQHYLNRANSVFPAQVFFPYEKIFDLRYGENPHQAACAYRLMGANTGVLSAKQHQGKQLSFNNITDADAAVACVREFMQPACVIVKHGNPCGVAVSDNVTDALQNAFAADSQSAFGGIMVLNRVCDEKTAQALAALFIEVLVAPGYTSEALTRLAKKPNLRVLEMTVNETIEPTELKWLEGGLLMQERDQQIVSDSQIVTQQQPTEAELRAMRFAWPVLKHIKSNAILISSDTVTVGIGAGQVSRVDAVDIALKKASNKLAGAVLASDAFFPFRDSIDRLAGTGIRAIIQPGGSVRDAEVIAACDELGLAMVFTGQRCFKH